jgi:dolichyl-phosphate-mannose--protein O-mannosyl transferase
MPKRTTKPRRVLDVIVKHWRSTIGSLMILVSIFLLIFKVITAETLTAIIAALLAAGYIPKAKSDATD